MRPIIAAVLVAFTAFSVWATYQVGYFGLFQIAFSNPGSMQVFFDLCIALGLFCTWMIRDARGSGRSPWPWVAAVVALGSIAALGYLLVRPERAAPSQ